MAVLKLFSIDHVRVILPYFFILMGSLVMMLLTVGIFSQTFISPDTLYCIFREWAVLQTGQLQLTISKSHYVCYDCPVHTIVHLCNHVRITSKMLHPRSVNLVLDNNENTSVCLN